MTDQPAAPASSSSLDLLRGAMTQHHASLDLLSLRKQITLSCRAEQRDAVAKEKKEKVAEAAVQRGKTRAKKEKAKAKEAAKVNHTMVRRSHLKEIMEKPKPSNDERQALVDHMGASKCFRCEAVKPVADFYRSKNRRVGIESTCSECLYEKFNTKPKRNFLRLMYNHCKSRAKKKEFEFDLVQKDLHDLFDRQEGLCALSSQPMTFIYRRGKREFVRHPTNASLDRIDPKRGYTKDNVQMTTNICNHSKMDLTEELFVQMCRHVAETATAKGR